MSGETSNRAIDQSAMRWARNPITNEDIEIAEDAARREHLQKFRAFEAHCSTLESAGRGPNDAEMIEMLAIARWLKDKAEQDIREHNEALRFLRETSPAHDRRTEQRKLALRSLIAFSNAVCALGAPGSQPSGTEAQS